MTPERLEEIREHFEKSRMFNKRFLVDDMGLLIAHIDTLTTENAAMREVCEAAEEFEQLGTTFGPVVVNNLYKAVRKWRER